MKKNIKRIVAYLLDTLLVSLVALLISNIPFVNKNYKAYNKIYDELIDYDTDYQQFVSDLSDKYKDKKITKEEYTDLLKNDIYSKFLVKKYEDNEITDDEYEVIKEKIYNLYSNEMIEYNFKLSKLNVISIIITIICVLIYFVVVQYCMEGQTLGKRIFSLKVVTTKNEKVKVKNLFFRTIILTGTLLNVLKIVILYNLSSKNYYDFNYYLNLVGSAIEFIILFMISYRSDSRGLHDIIGGTKVIDLNDDVVNSEKIIEAEFNEK